MKRQQRDFLSLPSFYDVLGFYFRERLESVTQAISGKSRNTNQSVRGQKKRMLFLLLILNDLVRWSCKHFSVRRVRIPQFAIWGSAGILLGYGIITYGNYWPKPDTSLDISGLINGQNVSQADWNSSLANYSGEDQDQSTDIPPELYPELAYINREPILIAHSGLPSNSFSEMHETVGIIHPQTQNPTLHNNHKGREKKELPSVKGIYHIVRSGENPWVLAKLYDVSHEHITAYNSSINPTRMKIGDKLFIPGAKEPLTYSTTTRMVYPLRTKRITSNYGFRKHPIGGDIRYHKGVDFGAPTGTSVRAVLDGYVKDIGSGGLLGRVVILKHANGLETVYGHNSQILVKRGQRVNQGDIISRVGRTGRATGPHLHFEVWENGKHQNPLPYLTGRKTLSQPSSLARR